MEMESKRASAYSRMPGNSIYSFAHYYFTMAKVQRQCNLFATLLHLLKANGVHPKYQD